jgi:hypothetical protein
MTDFTKENRMRAKGFILLLERDYPIIDALIQMGMEGFKTGQNNHKHTGFSCDECANLMKDDTWYMQSNEALAISEQVKHDMIEKFDKFLGQFVFWCGKDKSEMLEKWDAWKKEELI